MVTLGKEYNLINSNSQHNCNLSIIYCNKTETTSMVPLLIDLMLQ